MLSNTRFFTFDVTGIARIALITAELGRSPAVVKVTLQVNGRNEFLSSRPAKTTAGIKMKCDIIDYVGEGTPHANVGSSQITGGVSPYG